MYDRSWVFDGSPCVVGSCDGVSAGVWMIGSSVFGGVGSKWVEENCFCCFRERVSLS